MKRKRKIKKKIKIMDEVITVGDAASFRSGQATSFLDSPPSSSSLFFPNNLPLISAFLAFALAQFLKIFTTWSVGLIFSLFSCNFILFFSQHFSSFGWLRVANFVDLIFCLYKKIDFFLYKKVD